MIDIIETKMANFIIDTNKGLLKKIYKEKFHYIFKKEDSYKFDVLKKINIDNIIQLYDYDLQNKILYLEYFKNSRNFIDLLKQPKKIEYNLLRKIFYNIAYAIDEFHKYKLIHGDIRGFNILINNKYQIKINDFDWIKIMETGKEKIVDIVAFQTMFFQIMFYKDNLPTIKHINYKYNGEKISYNSCIDFLNNLNL